MQWILSTECSRRGQGMGGLKEQVRLVASEGDHLNNGPAESFVEAGEAW